MQALTPEHVRAALADFDPAIHIQHFDDSTATSAEAAAAVGCEVGQIAKSLCFLIDGEPILVIASGDSRVDEKKLAARHDVSRKRVKMATAQQCLSIYGYLPGGVPPVAHRSDGIRVYLDEQLKRYDLIYAAAGTASSVFPVETNRLTALTGGTWLAVARE